jgi:filamentous hemagglutinin family protein
MRASPPWLLNVRLATCLLCGTSAWSVASAAGPALPQPCVAGSCGNSASQFVTSGAATAVASKNALTVNQTSNNAILNWSSFNIAANNSVVFNQPGTSSIALNRIFQASPSQIFGQLKANGQIYLVNLNGFIFGPTATVNTGSLLVSSLPLTLTDANFSNGILYPLSIGNTSTNDPALLDAAKDPLVPGGRPYVVDANGNEVPDASGNPMPVQVVVQPGATLTAGDQGRVFLAGQNVTNGGTLTAPDGQVILAAGTRIFVKADTDVSLRGLIVEVDGTEPTATTAGNTAWNQVSGVLSAPRGNVTMVGLAVNQDGRVSATTSVSANGSIRLEAAGSALVSGSGSNASVVSTQGGALTIGPQSQMTIAPDTSSGTAIADQTQLQSSITLLGEQVILQGGSIVAPDASLTAIAASNPSQAAVVQPDATTITGVTNVPDPNARLHIDAGTSIDVSGSTASLPVTANLVSAQLRSGELADDPTQRNGPLHGLTVYFNVLDPPSTSLANVTGEISGIAQTIAQRTEQGGSAIFQSEGDLVFAKGASINVSGGSSTYAGGYLQTSYLVGANGELYPIATANPLLSYTGVDNPTFTQTYNTWGVQDVVPTPGLSYYQPGYVQGAAAGSVQFAASTMALQGTLQGSAVNGLYQRTPSKAVSGGTLVIGIPAGVQASGDPFNYLAPAVRLTTNPTPVTVADDASLTGPLTLDVPVSYLTSSGFTTTQIYSNAGVTLPSATPLSLPDGSTLSVSAARIDVLSSITDPAGSLTFQNTTNQGSATVAAPGAPRAGVYIGDDVTLDVRGTWTNDLIAAESGGGTLSSVWQDGGKINLGVGSIGALLSVGNDVTLHASGGAWLEANGTAVYGKGGTVELNDTALNGGLDVGGNLAMDAFGVNGAAGGTFSLTAPRIELSAAPQATGAGPGGALQGWTMAQNVDDSATTAGPVFQVYSSLFSDYGFQNVALAANGLAVTGAPSNSVLSVDPGTEVNAAVRSLALNANYSQLGSSLDLLGIASVTTLAPYLEPAATVSLTALPSKVGQLGQGTSVGDVSFGTGASITTAAQGSISITSLGSILDDGVLRAPGGTVSLHIEPPSGDYISYEVGFLPNQRIELGADATIDVSGTLVSQPSSAGLDLGQIYAGGTVDLFADRGAVVTDPGSRISIAGASGALDVLQQNGSYGREIDATAGGTLAVHSGEAISLLGELQGAAGSGGTTGAAQAGSLDITLSRAESWWGLPPPAYAQTFNQSPLVLELEPTVPSNVPASLSSSNQALLGAAQIAQSGIDSLTLESGGRVELSSNFSLSLARQLIIDAPVVSANTGAKVSLSAPYLEVENQLVTSQNPGANNNVATLGSGSLSFSGAQVALTGNIVFQGTSNVSFNSSGDLELSGATIGSATSAYSSTAGAANTAPSALTGQLTVAGNLTLDAARIYPTSISIFTIDAVQDAATGTPGTVTIGQTSPSPGTPLSAAGQLFIDAYSITSSGSLYAPFGSISLDGTHAVTLAAGSITSVSGDGLTIPFGSTLYGGLEWIYALNSSNPFDVSNFGIPARTVTLTAPNLTIAKGATIDLSGGGDLSAYEWVPGPGGSQDALAPATASGAAVTPGLYAVLPSTRGQAAPQDPQNADSSIAPGESVYLSGGGGLAAGYYPLLPARDALLPGAYLIQVESGFQSATAGSLGELANGTPVVAGYLTVGSTGLHQSPGYTGFAIYPGSYAQQLATYDVSLASSFFSAAATAAGAARPNLPADAGMLTISVTSSLDASGQVLTAAASGGIAAPIQISALDLVVGTASGTEPADAVSISDTVLNSWQPGSLLLGGTETPASVNSSGATVLPNVNVLANTVTIGAGTTLTAGQIIAVANQAIDVQSGATLESTSGASGTALTTLPTVQALTLSNASAGFLAVSDQNWLIPSRSNAVAAGAGSVAIDGGGAIATRGSLTIDGVGPVALNGTLTAPGAEWSLGSSSIAFVPATAGAGVAASSDDLLINPTLVTQLNGAGAVRLASTGAIDVLTPVTLGVGANDTPTLSALTLEASSLNLAVVGDTAGGTPTVLGAKTLTLEGIGTGTPATPTAGPAGSPLSLFAGELDLGTAGTTSNAGGSVNPLAVNGFSSTSATVSGAVVGQGTGGISVGGDLSLSTLGVTAATAANTTIAATGALSVTPSTGSGTLPSLLGGSLTLSAGTNLDVSGVVSAPSGSVTLIAGDNLTVDSGAALGAAGVIVTVGNQSAAAPGGSIAVSAGGNLTLRPGATLDVSGAGSAAAGSLALTAGGTASIGATLQGNAGAGAAGGSFSLDAGTLVAPGTAAGTASALTQLAAALTANAAGTAGGFTDTIDLRVRTGDQSLDAGGLLQANSVTVTADAGSLTIGGEILAPSGSLRGSLALFGGNGVELLSGSALHADGTAANGLGGNIEIGAGQLVADASGNYDAYNSGAITLDAGSTLTAAGVAGASGGTLLLRAPALVNTNNPANNDVAIQLGSGVTVTAAQVIVEPVLPFNTTATSADSADYGTATAPTNDYFQNVVGNSVLGYLTTAQPNIAARLASLNSNLNVEAGVEIVAPGVLTLPTAGLDLSAYGIANNNGLTGQPVDLTIRAAGSIQVPGTLSDGFLEQSTADGNDDNAYNQPTLLSGPSSSIRLVAGADLTSANPLAVLVNAVADLTIGQAAAHGVSAETALVRTGTGDVDLVASRDIVIAAAGSGGYTAGTPAIAPGGSASNPYPGVTSDVGSTGPDGGDPTDYNGLPANYGVFLPGTAVLMSFPTGGGNLLVQAGRDIDNLSTTSAGGVTTWQVRVGGSQSVPAPPSWGVNLAAYDWTFGTLGGGDVQVSAGRNATNISVAAADSLLPQASGATPYYIPSGGLSFTAGGNIGSAQVFVADGTGTVTAGGALTATLPSTKSGNPDVGSGFYVQDSAIDVTARLGAIIEGAFNPTSLEQSTPASETGTVAELGGAYYSYGSNSALNVESVAGDIDFGSGTAGSAITTLLGSALSAVNVGKGGLGTFPASLSADALSGNITFGAGIGTIALYPSATGQLDLAAAENINGNGLANDKLVMSDPAPDSLPTVASPLVLSGTLANQLFSGDIHLSDGTPALITAGDNIDELSLVIPKAAEVIAGNDISDLTYTGENLNATDLTLIQAGRDITYANNYSGNAIAVGGPGRVDLLAGRNINLGFSNGVITTGNLANANLPTSQGADLTLATGLGTTPDFVDFFKNIVEVSTTYEAQLVTYMDTLLGTSGLTVTAAETAFLGLTTLQQRPFIDAVFFNELSLSGLADNTVAGAGFTEGYLAIDTLFPGSRTASAGAVAGSYAGNLTLEYSRIYTLSGGNIDILVPGGSINVGLANAPNSLNKKPASSLGIVAEGTGDVNIYSKGDVNVNSSRIFTLGGGSILIWSDEGSIDAGLGAKTSVSAPPPSITISSNGTVSEDFSGAAVGSGIRTIQTQPDTPAGNVDLIAPEGTVNAGDAGIGAAGNINIAARSVLGVGNINFGGTATGVPAQVSSVSASLSGASNAASGASNTATTSVGSDKSEKETAAPLAQSALSFLDVFVTGLGEENCKPDDIECLKRQKTATK